MSTTIKNILAFVATIAIVLAFFGYQFAQGGTSQGSEYNATIVTSDDVGTSSIKSIFGTVGSVIVASTSPTTALPISIYNTSSTTIATTSLAAVLQIPTNTAGGTQYDFDVAFGSGIMVHVPTGFRGHYTITYR